MVVLDDIEYLWRLDLAGKTVAAVECWNGADDRTRFSSIGIRSDHGYFNAGLLVIDLDKWRDHRIAERLFAYMSEHRFGLWSHDQDALNAVLQDEVRLIERRWNVQTLWYTHWARRRHPVEYKASREALRRPAIIHYVSARQAVEVPDLDAPESRVLQVPPKYSVAWSRPRAEFGSESVSFLVRLRSTSGNIGVRYLRSVIPIYRRLFALLTLYSQNGWWSHPFTTRADRS